MRITNTLIRLRGCAGWFESLLGAHVRKYVFSRCGSFVFQVDCSKYADMTLAGVAIEGLSVKINDCPSVKHSSLCYNGITFSSECNLCYRAARAHRISKFAVVSTALSKPLRQKTYLRTCVPSEVSDQTAQSESSLGAFGIPKNTKFLCADKELFGQRRCAGWFESSLGAHGFSQSKPVDSSVE